MSAEVWSYLVPLLIVVVVWGGPTVLHRLFKPLRAPWQRQGAGDAIDQDPMDGVMRSLGLTAVASGFSGSVDGLQVRVHRDVLDSLEIEVVPGNGFLAVDRGRNRIADVAIGAWRRVYPRWAVKRSSMSSTLTISHHYDGFPGAREVARDLRAMATAARVFEIGRADDGSTLWQRLKGTRDRRALNGLAQVCLSITEADAQRSMCRQLARSPWVDTTLCEMICERLDEVGPPDRYRLVAPMIARSTSHEGIVLRWLAGKRDPEAFKLLRTRFLKALDADEVEDAAVLLAHWPQQAREGVWLAGLDRLVGVVRDESARQLATSSAEVRAQAEARLLVLLDTGDDADRAGAARHLASFGSLASVEPLLRVAEAATEGLELTCRNAVAAIQDRHATGERGGLAVLPEGLAGAMSLSGDAGMLNVVSEEQQ